MSRSHFVIPDTQVKEGVPTEHILAAGNLIVDRRPDVIVGIGDHWDMPSLGTHNDRGHIDFHGASYTKDLRAGIDAMELLLGPLEELQARQRHNKHKVYTPRLVFTEGNHEYRRHRLELQTPKLVGALSTPEDYLFDKGFEFHPFKQRVVIDGISYCHFCPQTKSAGAVERAHLILNRRHESWTVGHSQMLDYFVSPHDPRLQAIIAGAFYLHDEGYKAGSNDHWRGCIYKDHVENGTYNPYFYEIESLMKDYL